MPLMFNSVTGEDGRLAVTLFANGRLMPPVDESHPNFKAILGACQASLAGEYINEQDVVDLFDVAATVERAFARLSQRVTVENNEILFDSDPAQPGLSKQILRFMDEGEDFMPLVKFMENVMANPQPESRDQAWDWFNARDFTIAEDGRVVIYKGVNDDGKGGYCSGWSGTATVNDVKYEGQKIPYAVGDIVTMPRSAVAHDPDAACREGLHVGSYNYASMYGRRGVMMRVLVDPRDVVSVPHDANGEKIRVCRFTIDEIIESEDTSALYRSHLAAEIEAELSFDEDEARLSVGDRVSDYDGDEGTIIGGPRTDWDDAEQFQVEYDSSAIGILWIDSDDLNEVED
jgi:hypothetical protein